MRFINNLFGRKEYELPSRTLEDLKRSSRVLFVDDAKFAVVQILKNAGWSNTSHIRDIDSLDAREVAEAHIIFVDISGVGRKLGFADEGLGLIKALREKYPYKRLVVYSAEREGDRFHPGLSAADARLHKNADPYEFQSIVEQYSKEALSLSECVERLQHILRSEFGTTVTREDLIKQLEQMARRGDVSVETIQKNLGLATGAANAIVQIAKLFLEGVAN